MAASLRRDMDMIRDLLLDIEGGKTQFFLMDSEMASILGAEVDEEMSAESVAKTEFHLRLLADAKFITLNQLSGGYWHVPEISWLGCDFIDSIRDPQIWRRTKTAATKAGGFTVDLLKDVAKGLIKTQLKKYTGVELET